MKTIIILFFLSTLMFAQTIQDLEKRLTELEEKVRVQQSLLEFYEFNIEDLYLQTNLALRLNRDFTYWGSLFFSFVDSSYHFTGYSSEEQFNSSFKRDSLKTIQQIRANINEIKIEIEKVYSYPLIISYWDHKHPQQAFILGDKNSLKVRIDNVLTEVGWK